MTNKEVARTFNLLAKVMELHGENPFKTRSYSSAYNNIRRLPNDVVSLSREELLAIPGIGKNIADKIEELASTGTLTTLQKYLDQTPPGVVEMLSIKGFGPKKITAIWKELGIETPGELLYACEENRLVDLKGFGEKTQKDLRDKLIYFLDAQGKYLFGHVYKEATDLLNLLLEDFPSERFDFINDIRRQMPIVNQIDIIGTADEEEIYTWLGQLDGFVSDELNAYMGTKVSYEQIAAPDFNIVRFEGSASPDFLDKWESEFPEVAYDDDEEEVMDTLGMIYIPPEARETAEVIDLALEGTLDIISERDIKGVIHSHTTYSDGANTIAEMVEASIDRSYEYIVITDHSKSAFYANGLKEDDVLRQMEEIDFRNKELDSFKIFKGIESDILYDGQLDYDEEILEKFDLVIASVHSNLKMDQAKATSRIIAAVANPHTRILGHPTGRLLLSREGYPIDHMAVIDACAHHNVVIELNANPYRLDLDWTWIPYAVERGVLIAINPDAHSTAGIDDIQYGVSAARKACLTKEMCLNTLSAKEFAQWLHN